MANEWHWFCWAQYVWNVSTEGKIVECAINKP